MRFPLIEQLAFACRYERVVPGKLHADGRRYLPLLVLRPLGFHSDLVARHVTPEDFTLGIVDRHHRVDEHMTGQSGVAQLVCALSTIQVQRPPFQAGLLPEPGWNAAQASTVPIIFGQVVAVPTWEVHHGQLADATIYTELLLNVGLGTLGVRTGVAAADIVARLGRPQIEPGDWVELQRSRIDILGFERMTDVDAARY